MTGLSRAGELGRKATEASGRCARCSPSGVAWFRLARMGHYLWVGPGFTHRTIERFPVAAYCTGLGAMRLVPSFSWDDVEDEFLSDLEHQRLPPWLVVDPRRRDFLVVPTFVEPSSFVAAVRSPLIELARKNGARRRDLTITAPFAWLIRDFDRALKTINAHLTRAERLSRASFAGVAQEADAWETLEARFQAAYDELGAAPFHEVHKLLLYTVVYWSTANPEEPILIQDDTDLTEIVPENSYGWKFYETSAREHEPLLSDLEAAVAGSNLRSARALLREAAAAVLFLGDARLDTRLYRASAALALRGGDRVRARADAAWAEHRAGARASKARR
jgi:hypothetical protein